jgi:hypothetical protein
MNTTNEEPKASDNMELLKQQAEGCGVGCACHGSGASGKARWVICAIVLAVAGILVVRAMTKTDAASAQPQSTAFATPVASPAGVPVAASETTPEAAPEATPVVPAQGVPSVSPTVVAEPAAASAETMIGAFAELNTVAARSDAVFVYLLGKEETSGSAPATKAMQAAVRTIEAKGSKCAIFTLKAGSPDYASLAPQVARPGVLAMVKGKGMSAVMGEITETKLVQSYVAASSAGGCGSGGCAPGTPGCN